MGCTHHTTGYCKGLGNRQCLLAHIKQCHTHNIHLTGAEISQKVGIHVCHQCTAQMSVFSSEKKLRQHQVKHHPTTRKEPNTSICTRMLLGTHTPNYDPWWPDALRFIGAHMTSDLASFQSRLQEKVSSDLLDEVDSIMCSLMEAADLGVRAFVGPDGPAWDCKSRAFDWILVHSELLLLGPQKDKS